MQPKLEVRHLYKIFGDNPKAAFDLLKSGRSKEEIFQETGLTVGVKDASFEIYEGEIFVIMGLSGSGKSTLVRMLNRLIEPTAGDVLIDGENISGIPQEQLREVRRRKISMVFQSFALMPHMNVLENTAFGLEIAGVSAEERNARALEALKQVGLETFVNSYPDELSGGMQQRVGLARALANDPDVLLMDEAFSALDPLIRTEMQDELVQLQSEQKRTIVFISHDLDEAMRIGDRIAIMEGGIVVQVGTPDEILHNPANDYVRSFFRGVDVSKVYTARDVANRRQVTIIRKNETQGVAAGLQLLKDNDREFGYVVDAYGRFLGVVSVRSLAQLGRNGGDFSAAYLPEIEPITANTPVGELIGVVAQAPTSVPVVDDQGRYQGVISKAALLETLDREMEA